jgi:hypothetical protein
MLGTQDVYADGNWWGTTDTKAISTSIYDRNDNSLLGSVTFSPILTSEVIQAPTHPITPIPNLPVPPSWSPTTLPNEALSQTPSNDANNYFQVESNSTITELFFNSTSAQLSFTVTGQSGTTGYVQYKISKNLLSTVQNVKVFLDGSQLNVNITSDANSWLLYFTYHHSSHKVIIDLGSEIATAQRVNPLVWIAGSIVICALLIVIVAIRHRKKVNVQTPNSNYEI